MTKKSAKSLYYQQAFKKEYKEKRHENNDIKKATEMTKGTK